MSAPSQIVIGLGFGDEGKGSIVDAIVRRTGASTVVRFNGGAQASHAVVTSDGRDHRFSQWGSGTLAGARTILTRDVVIDPLAMVPEAEHLQGRCEIARPFDLLMVSEDALVATPFHAAMNRIREYARGAGAHGTCGLGIGEVMADARRLPADAPIRASDLRRRSMLIWKLQAVAMDKAAEATRLLAGTVPSAVARDYEILVNGASVDVFFLRGVAQRMMEIAALFEIADAARIGFALWRGPCVFEGAQGVLLDEWHGFHPHTTWSTTTSMNARMELARAGVPEPPIVVGVTRAYGTRHGAGPFPGEDLGAPAPPGEHNGQSRQGRFRVGALDGVLLRYALAADGNVSQLAVTCLDHADARRPPVIGYGGILAGAPMHPLFHHLAGGENRQLRVQEDRGRILAGAEPVFAAGPWDAAAFADWTGLPVAIESRGPRAEDKTWAA